MSYEPTSKGALQWMRAKKQKGDFLFRGQSSVYPSIPPSLFRSHISREQRLAWWRVRTKFVSAAKQRSLFGYRVPTYHDADAMLQHYLIKSAAIDMTGTPEVALYFALLGGGEEPRVVYGVSVEDIKSSDLSVTDHSFLAMQPDVDERPYHRVAARLRRSLLFVHRAARIFGATHGSRTTRQFSAVGPNCACK